MRNWLILAAALALPACGSEGEQPTASQQGPAVESGAAAQVAKLDEGQRNGVLERAIKAAGLACPSVAQSERAEVRKGVRGWRATCDNGTAHLIEIAADGTAKVTSRTQ
ncbi:hypothetical protein [Sphingobium bisphenolivorans]|uniref:hypothetical protein n=1 Tax=Sphingobium bisphenolivorans TaxID=1335760 RepID=UPI00047F4598|nr:hypothetical protein [Sphingobium bisphenolivorans]